MNDLHTFAIAAVLLVSAITLAPPAVSAQTAAGVGDDAVPVAAGGSRIRIGGLWTDYDKRFAPAPGGGTRKETLFSGYSRDNLGTADLPVLSAAEQGIRSLSGLGSAFALTLGKLEAKADVSRSVVPFQIDYGVTNRLSVTLVVPYVETTSNSQFILNRGGQGATVGQNPARPANSSARALNTTVVDQITQSRTQLTAEIARCADAEATGGGCVAIRGNPAGAQSLLTESASFASQLGALYGTATVPGAPVVPIQRSTVQTLIESRLAALRTAFIGFESNSLAVTSVPAAATIIYGSGGLQSIAQDSAFGLAYDTLGTGGRAGIGDVDLAANFLLLNTFGSQAARLNESKHAFRSMLTAGWRFGTATGGRSGSPFDLPTGDGANALLLRSTTDFAWSRALWMSGTVRVVKPLQDKVVTRFPATSDSSLFRPSFVTTANRTLGTRTEIELAPRYALGRSFGLSMAYGLGHYAASELEGTGSASTDPGVPATALSYATSAVTVQTLQFGASYSSLSNFTRGTSRWPVEVVYSHGFTLSASGGTAPVASLDRIELRVYTRFPRR